MLTPLTIGLNAVVRLIIKPASKEDEEHEEELRGMIALHYSRSDDEETREQSAMLSSVLDLGEVTVDEVMTHRASVAMVNAESIPEEAFRHIMESPYTRHPVFSGRPTTSSVCCTSRSCCVKSAAPMIPTVRISISPMLRASRISSLNNHAV